MSTTATISAETQQRIDERLDTIDRALLGLLSRAERLAITADIEARVKTGGVDVTALAARLAEAISAPASAARATVAARRRRSQLAVTAGSLGIAGALCLLAFPVAYILVSMLSDALGEALAIGFLSTHALLFTLCGGLAVAFGVIALVILTRANDGRTGHGWAITGLCTGTLPLLIGGTLIVVLGSSLVESSAVTVTPASYSTASTSGYPQPVYYPAPPMGSPMPMPMDTNCTSGVYPPAYAPGTVPMLAPAPLPPSATQKEMTPKPYAASAVPPATLPPIAVSPPLPSAAPVGPLPADLPSLPKQPAASAVEKAPAKSAPQVTEAKEEIEDE